MNVAVESAVYTGFSRVSHETADVWLLFGGLRKSKPCQRDTTNSPNSPQYIQPNMYVDMKFFLPASCHRLPAEV